MIGSRDSKRLLVAWAPVGVAVILLVALALETVAQGDQRGDSLEPFGRAKSWPQLFPFNAFQAVNSDLKQRWFGEPAVWSQPSPLPGTAVRFFEVTGNTQDQLIQSLDNAGLCATYKCAPDPAAPSNSIAWALEGETTAVPSSALCCSPSLVSYRWSDQFILLPRWSPVYGFPSIDLVQRWNALEGVIWIHETRHAAIANAYLAKLNAESQREPSCEAMIAFWNNPHLWDDLAAQQIAYHAELRKDCEPSLGCVPPDWMGWHA